MNAHLEPQIPRELHEKTVTAKLVYLVLKEQGKATNKEIAHHAGLSDKAVYNGLERLDDMVVTVKDPDDGRQRIHMLDEPAQQR